MSNEGSGLLTRLVANRIESFQIFRDVTLFRKSSRSLPTPRAAVVSAGDGVFPEAEAILPGAYC